MALFKCPECGAEISDTAQSCPHCGCPIKASATGQPNASSSNSAFACGCIILLIIAGFALVPIIIAIGSKMMGVPGGFN